mgnify:CR=1 FL=1
MLLLLIRGTIKKLIEENIYGSYSYIMHLSASTALAPYSEKKVLVTQVEEALTYGVDGISIHVNLGGEDEAQMLKDFGYVSNECEKVGNSIIGHDVCKRGQKMIPILHHTL